MYELFLGNNVKNCEVTFNLTKQIKSPWSNQNQTKTEDRPKTKSGFKALPNQNVCMLD